MTARIKPPAVADEDLLSTRAVAKRLGVSPWYVRDLVTDGDLVAIDIRRKGSRQAKLRFDPAVIRAYEAARSTKRQRRSA